MRIRNTLLGMCASLLAACGAPSGSAAGPSGSEAVQEDLSKHADGGASETPDHDFRHEPREELDHIFVIMMENHGTDEIIGNTADAPYLNELASKHALASSYFGVTHPSLPNYLALFSGDFQGIWDDCKAGSNVTCTPEEFVPGSGDGTDGNYLTTGEIASASATPHWFNGKNLVDQLEAHHRSWKAYMQSIPAAGDTSEYAPVLTNDGGPSTVVKLYAQKHDPFMYFADIRNDPGRMKRIVPMDGFDRDLERGHIPDFVWISPDQCHDMHGISPAAAALVGLPTCGFPDAGLDHGAIALGDAFVKETVTKIMHSHAWHERSAIVLVWDEDDYAGFDGCCGSPRGVNGVVLGGARAPALVITSRGAKHVVDDKHYNHYSLLGTIQHLWGLGCLGNTCNLAPSDLMTHLFTH